MKKITKKLIAAFLLISMMFSMTGCDLLDNLSVATNTTVTMKLKTEDTIQVKLLSESQMKLDYDENANQFKIWNKEKEQILECKMVNLETLEKFIKDNDIWMDAYGELETDSMVLSKCKHQPKDKKATYYIIGWVIGSNTGFIGKGTAYQNTLDSIITEMTFNLKKTSQPDDAYYPECVKMK